MTCIYFVMDFNIMKRLVNVDVDVDLDLDDI